MKLILTDEEVYAGITMLYDNIAERLGHNSSMCQYDCRKINVANNIFDRIYDYYRDTENIGMDVMGMRWCCFGPKCDENLSDYEIDIQDGFIMEAAK